MFGAGDCPGGAVESYFHLSYLSLDVEDNDFNQLLGRSEPATDFALNDQVIKTSATSSPASFLPTERARKISPCPLARACSIVWRMEAPSIQVKRVRPVAFLK